MNNLIEKTLAQFERLEQRKAQTPSVILMTTRQHQELLDYCRQRRPQASDVSFELTKLNGIQIEHFATMAEVYDRAANLTRDGLNVGVIPEPIVNSAGDTMPVLTQRFANTRDRAVPM